LARRAGRSVILPEGRGGVIGAPAHRVSFFLAEEKVRRLGDQPAPIPGCRVTRLVQKCVCASPGPYTGFPKRYGGRRLFCVFNQSNARNRDARLRLPRDWISPFECQMDKLAHLGRGMGTRLE